MTRSSALLRRLSLRGFTLIELLIVVAIIAILAAIAVPNFLEAQTRSKVSRLFADMRTIKTGLEAYRVDTNKYPETDLGQTDIRGSGVGMFRLTTPVAYITSIAPSPFQEDQTGNPGTPKNTNTLNIPLYVRAAVYGSANLPGGVGGASDGNSNGIDDNYEADRRAYLLLNQGGGGLGGVIGLRGILESGEYLIKSVGPDNEDDRNVRPGQAVIYDPTNGTVSFGDIVTFQDTSIPAAPKR